MKKHVLIEDDIYFMSFGWKCANAIQSQLVSLMGVWWVKSFEFGKRMLWVEKKSETEWKVWVSHSEKFSHLKNLDGMEKLENFKLNPLSSQELK